MTVQDFPPKARPRASSRTQKGGRWKGIDVFSKMFFESREKLSKEINK